MKKIVISILAVILIYGLFREFTAVKVLLMLGGLGSVYLVYRIPGRYILAMKYPLIALSLLATACFFFYPPVHKMIPMEPVVIFLSFYAIAFYLITLGEKGKGLYKEGIALSILFFTTCFNLFLMGKPVLLPAMSLAIMIFLFVIGRTSLMAVIGGYTLCIVGYLLTRKAGIAGAGLSVGEIDKYLLLLVTFVLLMFSFAGFMKKQSLMKLLCFFGFIYVAVDILLVFGFKLSAGLLYQPVVSVFIVAPLMGIMLKSEGDRA